MGLMDKLRDMQEYIEEQNSKLKNIKLDMKVKSAGKIEIRIVNAYGETLQKHIAEGNLPESLNRIRYKYLPSGVSYYENRGEDIV